MSSPSSPKRPKLDVQDGLPVASNSSLEATGSSTLAVPLLALEPVLENWVHLKFTHAGKEYSVELADSDR